MTAGAGPAPVRRPAPSAPWWLNPGAAVLLIVPVTVAVAAVLTDADFRAEFGTPKHLTTDTVVLCLLAALVLATTATLMITPARSGDDSAIDDPRVEGTLRRAARWLFWLTMLGYAAFAVSGVANGVRLSTIVDAVVSQSNYSNTLKTQFATVPGITTLTQVGMAFVIVALHSLRHRRDRALTAQVVVVFALATARAFLLTERLALIELAVPALAVVAVGAGAVGARRGRALRPLVRAAPFVALPVVFAVFAAFEYSRSWQYFASRTDRTFGEFALLRFGGYYATAYNNGQVQLDHGTWPGRLPDQSLSALWTAPGIGSIGLYDRLSALPPPDAQQLLERYANPEFNNPGGLTTPFVDFGTVGGLVFFAVAGLVLGVLYRGLRDGRVTGSLIYPLALTGLADMPRYLYWTQGRVVPSITALVVVALVVHGRRRVLWRPPPLAPPPAPRPAPGGAVRLEPPGEGPVPAGREPSVLVTR